MSQQSRSGLPEAAGPTAIALGQLSELAGFRVRKIQNRLTSTFTQFLAPFDLRPGTFSCLSIISRNPGISQSELAHTVGLDKTKIMQIIDDLEARGLGERVRSIVDRRCYALQLTAAGEQLTGQLFHVVQDAEERILGELSVEERKTLMGLLDKILTAMN